MTTALRRQRAKQSGRRTTSGQVALAILLLLLAGCSTSASTSATEAAEDAATTAPVPETGEGGSDDNVGSEAPDTHEPSDEEAGAEDDVAQPEEELEPAEVPIWGWVLAGLLLVVAVVWMASRSGAKSAQRDSTEG